MNSPMPKSMKLPDDKELLVKLAKARSSLALDHPFFGALAMGIPHVLANVPTAQTNGKRVQYGREFLAKLSAAEVKFLVAHECMHPMLGHPWRRGTRHPKKWNYAGDYVINGILTAEGIGKMIEGGLLNPEIVKQGGGTTDGIYAVLPEDYETPGGDGGDGGDGSYNGTPTDECTDDKGTPAEMKQAEDDWKVKVAQAAQAARTMGKMTAGVELLVEQILTPIVDWRDVLQRFLVRQRTDERTFARPNRRFASQGMYLPSATGEVMGEVAFMIDCSGSIGPNEIARFSAEMKAVKEWLNPSKMHVVYFDSQVSHYKCFDRDEELHVEPHGGGGTAFSPCFRYIEELGVEPVAAVFLTDLCCNDFGPAPSYPVLWVSTCEGTAPFGEIIVMKEAAR